ncbi:MAG: mechanosensitive ion channel family protein [Myxococcota bacterium]
MSYFEVLWMEAKDASTPWVLGVSVLAFLLSKLSTIDRARFKAALFFLAMHLVALAIAAGMAVRGSPLAGAFRTPAWVFGAVGLVGASATLIFNVVLPRVRVKLPLILQDVVVAIASVATAVAVAGRAGVSLSGLIATSAVFTAVLGFSLQDVIGNIAGGLALQIDNSIGEDDWIKVGDVVGRVVEVRWRHTAIETRNWETVLIPNAVLMKSQVTVLGRRQSQPRQLRRWVWFNVDWRHQPNDVIDVVTAAVRAAQIPNVAQTPAPNAVLMDMADTYGHYAVRYWLTDLHVDDPTDSAVRGCIFSALARAGMSPAKPAHALFVTEENRERKEEKSAQQLERCRKLLDALPFFRDLSSAERDTLARGMRYAPFGRGEVMTRQGADAHWLYLMEDGDAVVRVADGELQKEVGTLKAPTVFGEMSLLTGEPRSATVIATSDSECFRLDKAVFQEVLGARPELAEKIANLLAERRVALDAAREGLDAEAAAARKAKDATALRERIRRFFAL